jgi:hypothetical protein
MAPKKLIAKQLRVRLSPIRRIPEEGIDDEQEGINPTLNHHGSDFNRIVGTPARKEKDSASGSASATSTHQNNNPPEDVSSHKVLSKSS